MALSSVQIGNFALAKVGADSTIESLTEDSTEAKNVNLWFAFAREETLAAFNWSFARKRLALATHGEDAPTGWTYRYIYPSDCIKLRVLENPLGDTADPVPFEVETDSDGNKCIVTDLEDAVAVYTFNATNPILYSKYFVETFATLLASHIALPLTGKFQIEEKLKGQFRWMLVFASAMDASEKQEKPERDSILIRSR